MVGRPRGRQNVQYKAKEREEVHLNRVLVRTLTEPSIAVLFRIEVE